jgi:Alpha-L-arabinofuranosidase C-terminal domain
MKDADRILKSFTLIFLMVFVGMIPFTGWADEAVIEVSADQLGNRVSPYLTGACIEDVNHEIYGGLYSQMIFGESFQEPPASVDGQSVSAAGGSPRISGQWRSILDGDVQATFGLDKSHPFVGTQSQYLAFQGGAGVAGIENRGLNRWGMDFKAGKDYEGCLWVRSEKPTEFFIALESADGKTVCAEAPLIVKSNDWNRISFVLTPKVSVTRGRFAIILKQPGAMTIGYALLQPGAWGRFKGLPVRRDVADGMIKEGFTVLRYGGSMVNAPEYRWKKMTGPRGLRPPYHGTWYSYASNGWGIPDFLNFCEAAGILGIPDFNVNETPQDMADFLDYANGSTNTIWGARRLADGHSRPYGLKYLELGNEEAVNAIYAAKFAALAKAIWAKDPDIILVVGDFAYQQPIKNPFSFGGADSRITSLAAQQKILQLAKANHREVWFDLHVWTDGPRPSSYLQGAISFRDALKKIADGAPFRVVVFELNANNHSQRRALANALAIQTFERDGQIPVVTSANGLQPDGQNDNGWDQGLLFLNAEKVWLQPPGYVNRMLAQNYLPERVGCRVTGADELDANAKRSDDGKTLVLQVVNPSAAPVTATIKLEGFRPVKSVVQVEVLAGALDDYNTARDPTRIRPLDTDWQPDFKDGKAAYTFPANSFTVLRFN